MKTKLEINYSAVGRLSGLLVIICSIATFYGFDRQDSTIILVSGIGFIAGLLGIQLVIMNWEEEQKRKR